ncbi:hypothetical protein KDK95_08725 [Actinospica sp. MGRD01-02]|uniref:Uncharacterized protein n=1 Tax=Actinospica acidithermotolerans TaxID=2828514 RepID=A0A941E9H6_9ACTN|nr:hypothetical protein [Actinospica acidithermotolerans]MBR7826383.1 hypothetical protein [Actinospica acidithermotolerans]
MNPTPPLDARRPALHAASTLPEPETDGAALGMAHACPHCGRALTVLNVLVPADEPFGPEQPAGEPG